VNVWTTHTFSGAAAAVIPYFSDDMPTKRIVLSGAAACCLRQTTSSNHKRRVPSLIRTQSSTSNCSIIGTASAPRSCSVGASEVARNARARSLTDPYSVPTAQPVASIPEADSPPVKMLDFDRPRGLQARGLQALDSPNLTIKSPFLRGRSIQE